MEMKKRRQKTLTGLFLKFAALFCLDTFGIGMFCLVFLVLSPMTGFTLPANYAELQLTDHTEEIKAAGTDVEALIPDGCRYGIYDAAGRFKTGTFSADAQKRAWQGYKNGSKYASMGKYYRYIKQNSGDICIVKYDLHMRYAYDKLNGIVPSLEILTPVLGVVLFFLHAILLSGHFAKKLKRELRQLREVTEKIGQNDLEFETGPSQIKEIDDVMSSLSGMKEALKDSLTRQWDAQQQKKEQLAALTHDIKTPLTVIKGNAELLAETDLSAENRECTDAILANVGSMEQYLEHMRQLLYGRDRAEETEVVTCARLKEQFKEAAMQIADEFGIIYDNSVRSPPKPIRREKSPMQILEEAKTKTYRVLSDYLHLLKEWERNFRPKNMEKIDERYVEAVQNRAKVEFQLDTLLWGTEDEKEAVIHDLGKGVEDIERRVREYRRNQGAVNHNRQRSCEAVH